ncbi:unnamed protein product [Linum tenue]|uniref:Uncharacterized protein n=1 Tax=Linum tenue TaxID=586396 RepID=A0AAV0NRZ1_9ROSI|nr:unnamed protein product [Linum tenue]
MGWNYPGISLEEMVKLIKGFVDILLLASGYLSTGLLADWDSHNIKKAFQWASFFQNVLTDMSSTDDYQDSVKELKAALCHLKSDISFPEGLASISYASLLHAKDFVLEHLCGCLPLRNLHLRALLLAMVEVDLEKLPGAEHDRLNAYLNKLQLQNALGTSSAQILTTPTTKIRECSSGDLTNLTIEACLARQSTVLSISKVEEGLAILSDACGLSSQTDSTSLLLEKQKHSRVQMSSGNMELLVRYDKRNGWRSKNLSYFLHKRTIRMVAGASIMLSPPKNQWEEVLKQLIASTHCRDNWIHETIELLLLGCVANKWSPVVEYLMSFSCDTLTVLKMYQALCNLLPTISQATHFKVQAASSKETDILEYVVDLLGDHLQPLWQLSPVLVAVGIPFWSPVFRYYLSELEIQLKGKSSTMRCCNCVQEMKEHEECKFSFLPSFFIDEHLDF